MTDFRLYLASPATAERPSAGELDALAARYEWFAPVRIAREIVTGICDPRLAVMAPWRAQSSLLRRPIDAEAVRRLSSDDIIDRFLQEDDLRIVAADGEPEEEVRTAAELDDDDEIVSEVPDNEAEDALTVMYDIMAVGPNWAKGLPLKGDGYISKYYKKD